MIQRSLFARTVFFFVSTIAIAFEIGSIRCLGQAPFSSLLLSQAASSPTQRKSKANYSDSPPTPISRTETSNRPSGDVRYADRWPGIDRTGARDSSTGFNSLFAGGGHVIVPRGTYLISSTVTLSDNLYVWSQGATFTAGADNFAMFSSKPHAYYTQLANFTLDGNGHAGVTGFSLTQFIFKSRIDNVVIQKMTNGIVLFQLCWDTIIDNPRTQNVVYPLTIKDGSNVVDVRHPAFDTYDIGVQIVSGPTYPTVGVRIAGGYIQNGRNGIIDGGYGTQISDTYFEGNTEADVFLRDSILPYVKGTQHFSSSAGAAIKGRNTSGCRVEGAVMGSGARGAGLYDFDRSNNNCVEWHANTTSSLNTPVGLTAGLGSIATRDASGSLGAITGTTGGFANLLTAYDGLIVQGGPATLKNGLKVGISGSTISDSRELLQSVRYCGETTTCANATNGSYREVFGRISLKTGTAKLTGITPVFTSRSTFGCICTDQTSAVACKAVPVSTSSVAFSGRRSDILFYSCIGN